MRTFPNTSILSKLAQELLNSQTSNLKTYLETVVLLPTRRAVKELKKNLTQHGTSQTSLLPKIYAVNDLPLPTGVVIKPAMTEAKLLGLILKSLGPEASLSLAQDLMRLLDESYTHEVSLTNLADLVPETFSKHWEVTCSTLTNFQKKWSLCLAQEKDQPAAAYRTQVLQAWVKKLQNTPAHPPIFAVGLDGFIPSVGTLIQEISHQEKGQILLKTPCAISSEKVSTTHPSYLTQKLLSSLTKDHVSLFENKPGRQALATHLMADSPFDSRSDLNDISLAGLTVQSCKTLEEEAQTVSLLVRQALEDPTQQIAIITPDPLLSEQIQQQLRRWYIPVDLASGTPLLKTSLGRLISNSLDTKGPAKDPATFLDLLKHPKVQLGYDTPFALKKAVRDFEKTTLRNRPNQELETDLLEKYFAALNPLETLTQETYPISTWIKAHCQTLESLTQNAEGTSPIWQDEAGQKALVCFQELTTCTQFYPPLSFASYRSLLEKSLSGHFVREPVSHKRVRLLNPIQASFADFNQAFLCGLNEGLWPQNTQQNLWLNREMSLCLGLPDPQELIGRGAELFASSLNCPQVTLSYAISRNNQPAIPSRWILRLEALAKACGKSHELAQKSPVAQWQKDLSKPDTTFRVNAPTPAPSLERRPQKLSISDLEILFKDPYQLYAKKVLGLYPFGALEEDETQSLFGTWVHSILEHAARSTITDLQEIQNLAQSLFPQDVQQQNLSVWMTALNRFLPWAADYLHTTIPQFLESTVTATLDLNNTPFNILGKADRINVLTDGTYEIVDFKTGFCPSKKAVESLEAPQLPLLGFLFEKTYPQKRVSKVSYVALREQKILSFDAPDLIARAQEKLQETLKFYTDDSTAYEVDVPQALASLYNNYLHLERPQEWLEAAA